MDIKIVIHVVRGEVDLYMGTKADMFVIRTNQTNGLHHAFLDSSFVQPQFANVSGLKENSTFDNDQFWWLSIDDGTLANFELQAPYYLRERRIASVMPQYEAIDSLHEIAIFRKVQYRLEITIPYRMHDLRTTRFFLVLRGNGINDIGIHDNFGYVLFRQDQCRIDLFVFFSVFFSSFFLFLCFSVLLRKIKK